MFSSGLYPAMQDLGLLANEVVATFPVDPEAARDIYARFENLVLNFAVPICEEFSHISEEREHFAVVAQKEWDVRTGLIVCCVLIVLSYFLVYKKLLQDIHVLLRNNDSLPLLIPVHVAAESATMKAFFQIKV
jgi:hypothetical protein